MYKWGMEEQEQDAEFIRDLQDFFLPYSTAGKTAPLSSLSLIPLTLISLTLPLPPVPHGRVFSWVQTQVLHISTYNTRVRTR